MKDFATKSVAMLAKKYSGGPEDWYDTDHDLQVKARSQGGKLLLAHYMGEQKAPPTGFDPLDPD